jgi:hypothetical protein
MAWPGAAMAWQGKAPLEMKKLPQRCGRFLFCQIGPLAPAATGATPATDGPNRDRLSTLPAQRLYQLAAAGIAVLGLRRGTPLSKGQPDHPRTPR